MIDLFCQMIAIYESRQFDEIIQKDVLNKKLEDYIDIKTAEDFVNDAFKPIAIVLGNDHYWPTVLKDLSLHIRKGMPLIVTEHRLRLMLIYTKNIKKIIKGREEIYDKGIEQFLLYERLEPKKDDRLSLFEESTWFLYYGSRTYINSTPTKDVLTVSRVVLKLNSYGYMIIYNKTPRQEGPPKPQLYKGQYYLRANRYLFVEGRVNSERELRIIFDTEKNNKPYSEGSIILGHYSNASFDVSYGPIIIERVSNDVSLEFKIYNSPNDAEGVHPAIWGAIDKGAKFSLPTRLPLPEGEEIKPLKKDELYSLFGLARINHLNAED